MSLQATTNDLPKSQRVTLSLWSLHPPGALAVTIEAATEVVATAEKHVVATALGDVAAVVPPSVVAINVLLMDDTTVVVPPGMIDIAG